MWIPLPRRGVAPASADERRAAIERQLAWAKAGGAIWDGIDVRVDANGSAHGVAARALGIGEAILAVPRSLMIADDELDAPDLGFAASPRDVLATRLSLERRDATSRWRAYLDVLPHVAELPMFADDLAQLAGTAAHALVVDTARDIRDTHARLSPALGISLAELAWARAIVMSRAFTAPGTFGDHVALIPLLDLFDHGRDDLAWTYSPIEQTLVVRTERAIDAGDEVHFAYGQRSNTQLFVHYGFTMSDSAADEAALVFEPPGSAPIRVRVGAVFDERMQRALSFARLLACEPIERQRRLDELVVPTTIPFLDEANENAAFAILASAARRARAELDAHPRRAPTSWWDHACAAVREGERRVLDRVLEFSESSEGELRNGYLQDRASD